MRANGQSYGDSPSHRSQVSVASPSPGFPCADQDHARVVSQPNRTGSSGGIFIDALSSRSKMLRLPADADPFCGKPRSDERHVRPVRLQEDEHVRRARSPPRTGEVRRAAAASTAHDVNGAVGSHPAPLADFSDARARHGDVREPDGSGGAHVDRSSPRTGLADLGAGVGAQLHAAAVRVVEVAGGVAVVIPAGRAPRQRERSRGNADDHAPRRVWSQGVRLVDGVAQRACGVVVGGPRHPR